jgi:hypothetical protein
MRFHSLRIAALFSLAAFALIANGKSLLPRRNWRLSVPELA